MESRGEADVAWPAHGAKKADAGFSRHALNARNRARSRILIDSIKMRRDPRATRVHIESPRRATVLSPQRL